MVERSRFSLEMSSSISIQPMRFFSIDSSGCTLKLTDSFSSSTTSSASIRCSADWFSSTWCSLSSTQVLAAPKKSAALLPTMLALSVRRMRRPAALQVTIYFLAVQRDHAAGHRLQHRLVVVLDLLDVGDSLAFSSAIEICAVNARSRDSSSWVNGPPRLLSTCVTPMILPALLTIGTHRMERVK